MIHIVTALRAEAEPLARVLGLRAMPRQAGLRWFEGEGMRLVAGGVGRVAAAGAVSRLQALGGGGHAVWLNVGVAAHRELPLGEAVVAHKIVEEASGRAWYPSLIAEPRQRTATVCTVDRPVEHASGDRVYEMEASGFFAAALRWTTGELVSCVKVISDRGVGEGEALTAESVSRLLRDRAAEVMWQARALEDLASDRSPPAQLPDLGPALARWHFTVTQERQLEGLARRAAALGASVESLLPAEAGSSKEAMGVLAARLDELAGTARPEQP